MTQRDVAIVIVTFESSTEIGPCLDAANGRASDVVVIDNASTDTTRDIVISRGVRLIANVQNRGFAAAVNQGVRATSAPFIMLLNPDTQLLTSPDPLIEACASITVAAAGGKLISSDGRTQTGFTVRRFPTPLALCFELLGINRLIPNNPVNWNYRCLGLDLNRPQEAEQPAGAFLLFRRDTWERMNGFDEGFFPIWFEDVDFCKRLRDAGYRIFYRPDCVAQHTGACSISRISLGMRTEHWYRSLLRYSNRHFRGEARVLICLSAIAGCTLRAIAGGRSRRSREMFHVYCRVVKLAFRTLRGPRIQFGEILR